MIDARPHRIGLLENKYKNVYNGALPLGDYHLWRYFCETNLGLTDYFFWAKKCRLKRVTPRAGVDLFNVETKGIKSIYVKRHFTTLINDCKKKMQ
ncbi:MAG: hypothetical protein ABFS56_15800 [Pseudomonadota bacterium]